MSSSAARYSTRERDHHEERGLKSRHGSREEMPGSLRLEEPPTSLESPPETVHNGSMRSELHEQGSFYLCACGSLHFGECPIEYARYGIGSLDRHAARPRKARAPHRCDCAFTSPESADDNLLQRCGKIVTPGEIYIEIPRGGTPEERRLPSWTLTLACAVKYHSDTIVTGLDPDVKIGKLGSDEQENRVA